MSGRVRIGTCANPADAAFIRSMFAARGIDIVIGAEHHASLLGPIGGAFLSLDIWVAADDAEEAGALLRDLRDGKTPAGDDDGDDADGAGSSGGGRAGGDGEPDGEAGASADADADADDEDDEGSDREMQARAARRRLTGLAILLGFCVTFGTAHMATRAWLRGLLLAAIEIIGIRYLARGDRLGALLVVGAILADLTGALWRLRDPPALPTARIRRS